MKNSFHFVSIIKKKNKKNCFYLKRSLLYNKYEMWEANQSVCIEIVFLFKILYYFIYYLASIIFIIFVNRADKKIFCAQIKRRIEYCRCFFFFFYYGLRKRLLKKKANKADRTERRKCRAFTGFAFFAAWKKKKAKNSKTWLSGILLNASYARKSREIFW